MQRLFLELEHGQGFEGMLSFMAESVAVAKQTLVDTITAVKQAQDDYDVEMRRRGAYLRELQVSIRDYALDEIPEDTKKQIAIEMKNTDLRNHPRPSYDFTFYGATLSLGDFCHDHDGFANYNFDPKIVTVDELVTHCTQ